jgi:uncharacterized protein YbjT (DUF2867 family)
MFIILGATGHVGGAAARALLQRGEAVTVVTRDAEHGRDWVKAGARVAECDVTDVAGLRAVFSSGRRAFLLNPPADPSADTDAEERRTAAALVAALDGSGLEKVVAQSTYGAQPGGACGDLTTLYALEEGRAGQPIPAAVNRAAYYFSNLDVQLEAIRREGVLRTMFPSNFALPMAAPADLGEAAARRLMSPESDVGLRYVEGPDRYTPQDVADAFAAALDRPVRVETAPREQWEAVFRGLGFSEAAAASYARITEVTLDGDYDQPDAPERGTTTLQAYVERLVSRSPR